MGTREVDRPYHSGERRRMAGGLRCWATHRWLPKNRVARPGKGLGLGLSHSAAVAIFSGVGERASILRRRSFSIPAVDLAASAVGER
jgi:hypothetical protein